MSTTARVLIGLTAGLAVGITLSVTKAPFLTEVVSAAVPVGTLWLNALRMTIVLLVVSLIVTGVAATADAAASGRLAVGSLLLFVLLLSASALFGAIVSPVALALLPADPARAAALRESVASSAAPAGAPPFAEWVTGIVPANPFGAAAEGAMLPLVVFALFFGFALTRIAPERRQPLVAFFQAVVDTMMVIVHWVLWAAPVGVFALVLPVGARAGVGAIGALAAYVVLISGLCAALAVAMYPVASVFGKISIGRFARAVAPAQAVAFSTQSSLASLPAMLEGVQTLGLTRRVTALVLPLAVSIFRITGPATYMGSAAFVAWLYGVEISFLQFVAGAVVGVVVGMGAVGLPGHVSFMGTHLPVLQAMGLPLEPLGLMLAMETIPDVFATVGNVTADVAATSVVADQSRDPEPVPTGAD